MLIMINTRSRDNFLLVFIVLAISINIAISHYHSQYKIILVEDWLSKGVSMPFGGRSFVSDLVRFIVNIFNVAYNSRIAIGLFISVEAISLSVASLLIIFMTRKEAKGTISSPIVLLGYFIFLWQVSYTLFITPVHRYWFSYDVVSLFVMSLGLFLITTNKFLPLLVTVALGTWNRETTIVLASWYFLFYLGKQKTSSLVVNTLILFLTSFLVKYFIWWRHQLTPNIVSLYDNDQLRFFLNIAFLDNYRLLAVFGVFGFLWIFLPVLIKRQPNSSLVRCLWSFPFYFLGMLVVGNINEIRIFIEFIPLVTLVLITGLARGPVGRSNSPISGQVKLPHLSGL